MTAPHDVKVDLLPCPFCGGKANMDGDPGSWGHHPATAFVRCSRCGMRGPSQMDDEGGSRNYRAEAATAWNTRAPDRALADVEADSKRVLHDLLECKYRAETAEAALAAATARGDEYAEAIENAIGSMSSIFESGDWGMADDTCEQGMNAIEDLRAALAGKGTGS